MNKTKIQEVNLLKNDLEILRLTCEQPKLHLAKYFLNLKNRI